MDYEVTLTELAAQHAAVVHGEVAMGSVGPFIGQALEKVTAALSHSGTFPVGPPFARYDMLGDRFAIDAGFPCGSPSLDGDGDGVRMITLPGGLAATTTHAGPFDQVGGAYRALERWMRDNGYEPAGGPWETYLDGPEAARPRTVVTWPCEGRG